VQVVHPGVKAGFSDSSGGQIEIDRIREQAEQGARKLREEAASRGVTVEVLSRGGEDVADTLIKTAEEVGADLMVVGNRGMSGVSRFVLGSVPNKISHHCPCNLLIVNTEPEPEP
jgi:nucleotide-binding universal stress UspA family protein